MLPECYNIRKIAFGGPLRRHKCCFLTSERGSRTHRANPVVRENGHSAGLPQRGQRHHNLHIVSHRVRFCSHQVGRGLGQLEHVVASDVAASLCCHQSHGADMHEHRPRDADGHRRCIAGPPAAGALEDSIACSGEVLPTSWKSAHASRSSPNRPSASPSTCSKITSANNMTWVRGCRAWGLLDGCRSARVIYTTTGLHAAMASMCDPLPATNVHFFSVYVWHSFCESLVQRRRQDRPQRWCRTVRPDPRLSDTVLALPCARAKAALEFKEQAGEVLPLKLFSGARQPTAVDEARVALTWGLSSMLKFLFAGLTSILTTPSRKSCPANVPFPVSALATCAMPSILPRRASAWATRSGRPSMPRPSLSPTSMPCGPSRRVAFGQTSYPAIRRFGCLQAPDAPPQEAAYLTHGGSPSDVQRRGHCCLCP